MLKSKISFRLVFLTIILNLWFTVSCSLQSSHPPAGMPVFENQATLKSLSANYGEEALAQIKYLVHEKNYSAAIRSASAVLGESKARSINGQITGILGDIFEKKGDFDNAICFYVDAFKTTSDETKKNELLQKAIAAGLNMNVKDLASLLKGVEPMSVGARLLYETAATYRSNRKYENALSLVHALSENLPQFRETYDTYAMIEDIENQKKTTLENIGVILPLSGKLEKFGQRALSAIQLAVHEVNTSQRQFTFRIIVKDSGKTPQETADAVDALEKEGVICIIGPISGAGAAAEASEKLKMPILLLTQKEDLPVSSSYVFRNFITPRLQADSIAAYFINEKNMKKFAVLSPEENYGRIFSDAFINAVSAYGGEVVKVETYLPGSNDFARPIKHLITGYETADKKRIEAHELKRNKKYRALVDFDVLFIPDTLNMVNLIAPQLQFHGIEDIVLTGTNIWYSEKNIKTGAGYLENAIFPVGFFPEKESDKVAGFIQSFRKKTGESPGYIDAISYDTALLLMKTLSTPGITSRKDLIKKLKTVQFTNGVTCPVSFNQWGESSGRLDLVQVKNEKMTLID